MRKNKFFEPVLLKEKNPYEVLEISQDADNGLIRKAYLKKLRLFPPERDPEGFKLVNNAYSSLKDIEKRKIIDLNLYKTESGIKIKFLPDPDLNQLVKDRISRFFLASSDLYIDNFSDSFNDITDDIKKLK